MGRDESVPLRESLEVVVPALQLSVVAAPPPVIDFVATIDMPSRSAIRTAPRRCWTNSRQQGRRSSGLFARARATTSRSAAGRASRSGGWSRWPRMTSLMVPSNGTRPVRSW